MDISINTPALLFPALSLVMLAYTNRFMALSSVIRNLHDKFNAIQKSDSAKLHGQIKNLKFRIRLIKNMQIMGALSILCASLCMYLIYIGEMPAARWAFATSIMTFTFSILLSIWELIKSTKALEIELSDMEGLEDPSVVDYIVNKLKT